MSRNKRRMRGAPHDAASTPEADAAQLETCVAFTLVRRGGGWSLVELEVPVDQARVIRQTEPDPLGLIIDRLEHEVQRMVDRG